MVTLPLLRVEYVSHKHQISKESLPYINTTPVKAALAVAPEEQYERSLD
jgi:hypothetical protein